MTATNVQLVISNTAKRAGIAKHVTPHVLRHSFATNFLKNNGNMRYLSAMLGHASMDTTMMYAHVVDTDLQRQYEKYHTI
jgi:site-specific recombinase XerD